MGAGTATRAIFRINLDSELEFMIILIDRFNRIECGRSAFQVSRGDLLGADSRVRT
jgi:hypothetical protein